MLKTVDLIMVPNDPECKEAQEFLEQQDLRLRIRDVKNNPLSAEEIARLIRHLNLKHFLNTSSKLYATRKMENTLPSREEAIELMAEDNDLLRKPIVIAGRLMVVGANRGKMMEMLQIKSNGSDPSAERSSPNRKKHFRG